MFLCEAKKDTNSSGGVPRLFCEVANWVVFFSDVPNLACSILSWCEVVVGEKAEFFCRPLGSWVARDKRMFLVSWNVRGEQGRWAVSCGRFLEIGESLAKVEEL